MKLEEVKRRIAVLKASDSETTVDGIGWKTCLYLWRGDNDEIDEDATECFVVLRFENDNLPTIYTEIDDCLCLVHRGSWRVKALEGS